MTYPQPGLLFTHIVYVSVLLETAFVLYVLKSLKKSYGALRGSS